jgi:hypothetical protein
MTGHPNPDAPPAHPLADVLEGRVSDAAGALSRRAAALVRPGAERHPGGRTATAAQLPALLAQLVHAAAQADIQLGPGVDAVAAALKVSTATAIHRHGGAPANLPLIATLDPHPGNFA